MIKLVDNKEVILIVVTLAAVCSIAITGYYFNLERDALRKMQSDAVKLGYGRFVTPTTTSASTTTFDWIRPE